MINPSFARFFQLKSTRDNLQRFLKGVKHAFALNPSVDLLTDDELALLERLSAMLIKRKLAAPAILFLETMRPVNYIGAQSMIFFRPFFAYLFPRSEYDRFAKVFEKRESIDRLIHLLERDWNTANSNQNEI